MKLFLVPFFSSLEIKSSQQVPLKVIIRNLCGEVSLVEQPTLDCAYLAGRVEILRTHIVSHNWCDL